MPEIKVNELRNKAFLKEIVSNVIQNIFINLRPKEIPLVSNQEIFIFLRVRYVFFFGKNFYPHHPHNIF